MRQTLDIWPNAGRRCLSDDGEGLIEGATYHNHSCGCRVTGNGTLQLPLGIEYCPAHHFADELIESLKWALTRMPSASGGNDWTENDVKAANHAVNLLAKIQSK